MSSKNCHVSLAAILQKTSERIHISSSETYREITVKLNGKGVVPRKEVSGATLADARKIVARAGQLILSRIDARNGAIGIVPVELDGAIVSNDFPCFTIDTARVCPSYLHWVLQAPSFISQLNGASSGTTNRVRLHVDAFLGLEIPLPSIDAQRRIAGVVSDIASRVVKLFELRGKSQAAVRSILSRAISEKMAALAQKHPTKQLGDFLLRRRDLIALSPGTEYAGVGTRMWGLGTYIHERRDGGDFDAERYSVTSGQLIYNEVWAHHGAIGIVGDLSSKLVVSRHFHVFDLDQTQIDDRFLQRFFQSTAFWAACKEGSVGTTGRGHMRRGHLMSIEIPAPPLRLQEGIAGDIESLHRKLVAVQDLQATSSTDLDALLPAMLDKTFKGEL